jgi:hypothetical protein
MNPCKVQTIVDWVMPTTIHDVQCSVLFTNFYWHFIAHYFMTVIPFIHLIQKGQNFIWKLEVECAF